MRPSPRRVLVHKVIVYSPTGTDRSNKPTYGASAPVSFVLCEPVSAWRQNSAGEMKDDKLTLFFDCVNSEPNTQALKKATRSYLRGVISLSAKLKIFLRTIWRLLLNESDS